MVEIPLGHLRRNVTHPGPDDRLGNARRQQARIGRVTRRISFGMAYRMRLPEETDLAGGREVALGLIAGPRFSPAISYLQKVPSRWSGSGHRGLRQIVA